MVDKKKEKIVVDEGGALDTDGKSVPGIVDAEVEVVIGDEIGATEIDVKNVLGEDNDLAPEIVELYQYWLNRVQDCVRLIDTFTEMENVKEVAELAVPFLPDVSDQNDAEELGKVFESLTGLMVKFGLFLDKWRDQLDQITVINQESIDVVKCFILEFVEFLINDSDYQIVSDSLTHRLSFLRAGYIATLMPVSFLPPGIAATNQGMVFGQDIYGSYAALYGLLKEQELSKEGSLYAAAEDSFIQDELKAKPEASRILEKKDELYGFLYRQKSIALTLLELTRSGSEFSPEGEFYIDDQHFQESVVPFVKSFESWLKEYSSKLKQNVLGLLSSFAEFFPDLLASLLVGEEDGLLGEIFSKEDRRNLFDQVQRLDQLNGDLKDKFKVWTDYQSDDEIHGLATELAKMNEVFGDNLQIVRSLRGIQKIVDSDKLGAVNIALEMEAPIMRLRRLKGTYGVSETLNFWHLFSDWASDSKHVDINQVNQRLAIALDLMEKRILDDSELLNNLVLEHLIGEIISDGDQNVNRERWLSLMLTFVEALGEFTRQYLAAEFADDEEVLAKIHAAEVRVAAGDFISLLSRHAANELSNSLGMYSSFDLDFAKEIIGEELTVPENSSEVEAAKFRGMVVVYRGLRAMLFYRICETFLKEYRK